MEYKEVQKLMEIQYIKGRLDELYKGYVPNYTSTENRFVDSRISKYEDKLKSIDETVYHLYQVERENQRFSKLKSKRKMSELLSRVLPHINDEDLKAKIKFQIETY